MKKIEAIVRKSKFREVKSALLNAGITNFSYWLVRNVGEATESRVYRGVEYETSAVERIHLQIVTDMNAKEVVQVIAGSGLTGEAGDGRIFVTSLSDAYQLKTKDGSDQAISLK